MIWFRFGPSKINLLTLDSTYSAVHGVDKKKVTNKCDFHVFI